jgi:hypothetical protein
LSTVTLTPVTQSGYWRVELKWPRRPKHYFGKFHSQAEAKKWIEEHRWLTEQRQEPDAAEADDPDDPEAANDR